MKLRSEKRGQGNAKGIHQTAKCWVGMGEKTGSNNKSPSISPRRLLLIRAATAFPGSAPLSARSYASYARGGGGGEGAQVFWGLLP